LGTVLQNLLLGANVQSHVLLFICFLWLFFSHLTTGKEIQQ